MHSSPLTIVAAAILVGVAAQSLASLLRVPAIVFLLLLGTAVGPHGLGLIEPDDLGTALPVIVSAFVAVILFEGALTLRPELIRRSLGPVRRLITVGAAVTWVGAAALSHFLTRLPWSLAFLFAALVVVTGPTVIAPILRRVRLLPRLHSALKSESILIDPIGVFLAVVVFQYVGNLVRHEATWSGAVAGFASRLAVGALVGGLAGGVAALTGRLRLFHHRDNEHLVNLGGLGLALGTFTGAEHLMSESGVLAVIVAGLILAAVPIPFREELEKFKEHVTTLGVSILFVLLAADLNLPLLLTAGWREAALLAALIFVLRPAAVFLSTLKTDLSAGEKAYLALMAPRGILAAAMAGYFSGQLRQHGLAGAGRIEMLVFLTVGATVCLQGCWAGPLARLLGVQPAPPQGLLLVGVNDWSLAVAGEVRAWGRPVLFVDSNPASCDRAREQGFAVHRGDATERETYRHIDLTEIGTLVAMTPNDAVNTLACEAASAWLGSEAVLQVVTQPGGAAAGARVRMGGRRAMPTHLTHREIVDLLAEGRLQLRAEIGPHRPGRLTHGRAVPRMDVPLLVLSAGRMTVAVEGQQPGTRAIVIGLAAADVGAEAAFQEGAAVRAGLVEEAAEASS